MSILTAMINEHENKNIPRYNPIFFIIFINRLFMLSPIFNIISRNLVQDKLMRDINVSVFGMMSQVFFDTFIKNLIFRLETAS